MFARHFSRLPLFAWFRAFSSWRSRCHFLSACGFNTIPTAEEQAKAAWSEVLNQYQRRADLIPNLVETVKGYARMRRTCWKAWSRRAPRRRR